MNSFENEKALLTDSQLGIYLECINDSNCATYLIPLSFSFSKEKIESKRLAESFNMVAENFSAFSVVINVENSQPFMTNYKNELPKIEIVKTTDEEVAELKNELFKPFAFDGSLLWRGKIFETETQVILSLVLHHTIFDGTSIHVLNKAISFAYDGKILLEDSTVFDAKEKELSEQKEEIFVEATKYFDKYLDGLESDSNINPDTATDDKIDTLATSEYVADVKMTDVVDFAKDNGVTENIIFLSSFAYTLSKFNNQKDVVFSSAESGRFGGGYENSIGMFVKSFPIRIKIDELAKSSDYVKEVKKNFFDTLSHNHVNFSDLLKEYPGCADVRYIYQGKMFDGIAVNDEIPSVNVLDTYEPVSNLDFLVFRDNGKYKLWIGYKSNKYSRELIDCFADLFLDILQEMLKEKTLKDINLFTEKSKEKFDVFNDTNVGIDESKTIIDYFKEAVKNNGNNVAVSYKEKIITYSQLDILTKKLALFISKKGLGRDDFVSVLIPRNEYMAITSIGIVRAGAAYQPLDPTYPEERLNFMVKDSKARLLIADRSLIHLLNDYNGDVLFTDEIDALTYEDDFNFDARLSDALILIYTSGTTGTPKGCILENKNIVSFYYQQRKMINLSASSHVASTASFGFDAALMDIFTTLVSGATLYIIPEEIKLDLDKVEAFYEKNKITNGFMTTQLGRMFLERTKCKSLKHFILGGEKLVPFTPPEWVNCVNCYGPSETTAYVCGYKIKDSSPIQPIGKANINTKFYVIDSESRLLPLGACGELCIAGLQVGRGYFERPEKTAEVFVSNSFCDENGYEKIYKTGDIVRILPDGNVDFIGRRDGQVKIRGFRIELTEVEQVIREYDKIKNATVQAYDDPVSGKYIAAFIVSDEKINTEELNSFIAQRKPPYMVPAVTMQIDKIPVNANSKVDRRKLPKPERKVGEIIRPKNEIQQKIVEIVSQIIGTDEFSIDNDFYMLGLSSIGSIRLCSLLADEFNVSVQMKDLRKNSSVIKLEKFISSDSKAEMKDYEKLLDYPLTKTQEGIFVECVSNPDSTFYNIPLLLKISSKIDVEKLKSATVNAVNAHSFLMTELFADENGNIRQKRAGISEYTADEIDVISDVKIKDFCKSAVIPFNLTNSRLFRFKIIKSECNYFFAEFHHIIADGTSINIIIKDIEKAYNGEKIEKEKFTSFELSLIEQEKRSTDLLKESENYYYELLNGLDLRFLPENDRLPSSPVDSGIFEAEQKYDDFNEIQKFCSKNAVSVNGFLCSAFGFVLAKYSGTEYSVFNTVYNGRNDSRTSDTVGMLVKTLPVVCNIEKENSTQIVKAVSEQLIDSMSNDLYSFAEISKNLGIKNDIIFVYQGDDFKFNSFCAEPSEEINVELSESKAPLTLQVAVVNNKLKYIVEYDAQRFTKNLISTIISAYDKVISSFIDEQNPNEISLLTDEITAKLDEYNNTEIEYDKSQTIVSSFINKVKAYSDKLCIGYNDKKYTFSQVYNYASRIASYLNSKGIGKGDVVSILINRDENMVISSYGVIMSGSAYVGLDPTYPKERLKFMIEDSGSKIVIADRKLIELIDGYDGEILFIDEVEKLPAPSEDFEEKSGNISPDDNALIIYSSGTTGVPKGAILRHKNITCFMSNYLRDMNLSPDSNIASYASFGFDGGAMDVFSPAFSGAALYVIPNEIRLDIEKIEQFFIDNKITNGFMTTQVGVMFVKNTKCKTLTHIMVGGEKIIPVIPPEGVTLYNGYGPSETFCYVNRYSVCDAGSLQPIGSVNANIKEYIIDKFGNRLPFGACGELCIAGGQTGLGYLNRAEKTAEVFVNNPFCDVEPYDRMYKTGDIVRQMPDGNYVFVGRRDGQVKIRGFRVELTEIERQIRKYKGIENVTVQAFDSNAGGKYLAAYIVSKETIDITKLNSFIASEKPDYMVPSITLQIDEIPLTSNGKVDRKKLPISNASQNKTGLLPANETEEAICEVFSEVLGIEKVYADDDFFRIGGSSISAIQVVVKCNQLGYDIVFKNLFANPTPHGLAEFIQNGRSDVTFAPSENEAKEYDYSALECNTVDNLGDISYSDIGDVLLTGVTGFLGCHILKELLDNTNSNVICLVRGKSGMSAETRFEMMMTYYFEDWFNDTLKKRVNIVEGELDSKEMLEKVKKYRFNTIINSAANVKHFAAGDSLIKDNYSVVQNLIDLAKETNAKLIQISSTSVSGEIKSGNASAGHLFKENELNIGQMLENKYIYSKYLAEQAVIDSISKGIINGKIIRLGNLMARFGDSEFQINAHSNGFLRQFSGYFKLGMFPVDLMDKEIEFSPIDSVARAVVKLSGTPDKFTVFHAKNCNEIHYGYLVEAMIKEGLNIRIVDYDVFKVKYQKALTEEKDLSDFTSLIAYLKNKSDADDSGEISHQIESDSTFTTKALYRLGFAWPLISSEYLRKMVRALIELGFFTK